jgi:hypothetical protein
MANRECKFETMADREEKLFTMENKEVLQISVANKEFSPILSQKGVASTGLTLETSYFTCILVLHEYISLV